MNSIEAFIKQARKQIGKQYEWGTAGPETFDCSGLIYYCINQIQDPDLSPEFRSSQRQWEKLGRKLERGEAYESGDLLFWGFGQCEHVGIYLRDEGVLHAFNEDAGVVISPFNGRFPSEMTMGSPFLGTRRLTEPQSPKATGSQTSVSPTQNPFAAQSAIETASFATTPPSVNTSRNTMITSLDVTTPFRKIGDVPIEKWREVMKTGKIQEIDACYDACKGYSALALAQAVKESSLGTAANSIPTKNPLGLMEGSPSKLVTFASYPLAFADFRRRVSDPGYKATANAPGPYYKGDKGIVPGYDMSILAYLITYVGGPDCLATRGQRCANGETYDETKPKDGEAAFAPGIPSINLYTAQTLKRIREWLGIGGAPTTPTTPSGDWQRVSFAGSNAVAYLPTSVLFRTVLTPRGNNRPGGRMVATSTTQHETGNTRVGANAKMHSNWQDGGTQGHPDGYVGVHFYVDDDQIIQKIPVNETSIHSGDWRNSSSISVERCVNSDQTTFADSETNSAWLQASLLKYVVGKSAKEAMYPHYTNTVGQGTCPVNIGYHWSGFEDRVDRLIAQLP
jgi:hypothetical protein